MAQVTALSLGGIGSPCCCGSGPPPMCTCTPCDIPKGPLTLSFSSTSVTLVEVGSTCVWKSVCRNFFLPSFPYGGTFVFTCGPTYILTIYYDTNCPTSNSNFCTPVPLTSHTCSPLSLTFTLAHPQFPGPCNTSGGNLITANPFVITYP